jgi:hypothetical protein
MMLKDKENERTQRTCYLLRRRREKKKPRQILRDGRGLSGAKIWGAQAPNKSRINLEQKNFDSPISQT